MGIKAYFENNSERKSGKTAESCNIVTDTEKEKMGLPKVFFHFCYETGITHIPSGLLIFPFNIPSYAPRITPSIAVSMTSCMFHKAGIISLFQLSYVWHDLVLHPFDGACDASNIFHNHCENYTDNEDSFNNGNKHLIHPPYLKSLRILLSGISYSSSLPYS